MDDNISCNLFSCRTLVKYYLCYTHLASRFDAVHLNKNEKEGNKMQFKLIIMESEVGLRMIWDHDQNK